MLDMFDVGLLRATAEHQVSVMQKTSKVKYLSLKISKILSKFFSKLFIFIGIELIASESITPVTKFPISVEKVDRVLNTPLIVKVY